MSPLAETFTGRSSRPAPVQVPPVPEVSNTYLSPADPFPDNLAELELLELQVLHSRITRQHDREYFDPHGPHPVTVDRAQELVAELDTRQQFLPPTRPAYRAEPRTEPSRASQGASRQAATPSPVAVAEDRATAARVE